MDSTQATEGIEKHYSLSALSKESGIRKKTLSDWIANGWLVGDKVNDCFELYTGKQLNIAKIYANRAYKKSVTIEYTPEEKAGMTLLECTIHLHINSQDEKYNHRKNKP